MIDLHHPAFTSAAFSFHLTHLVYRTPGFKASQLVIPHSADNFSVRFFSICMDLHITSSIHRPFDFGQQHNATVIGIPADAF